MSMKTGAWEKFRASCAFFFTRRRFREPEDHGALDGEGFFLSLSVYNSAHSKPQVAWRNGTGRH